ARLEKKDKAAEALEVRQAAFDLDPSDEDARAKLLAAYVAAGAPDKARKVARGAAELKQLAQAYEKAGKTDAVLEILGEVAALDPSDIEVRAGLALAYVSRGDMARARTYLSAETAGENAALWLTLAEI